MAAALAGMALLEGFDLYEAIRELRSATVDSTSTVVMHGEITVPAMDIQALARSHLFGSSGSLTAGRAAAAAARNTTLVLTGTIATADPAIGFALIGPSRERAQLHPAGAAIASGVMLREVYPDRVIVERAGSVATVFLPRGAGLLAAMQAPAAQPASADAAADDTGESQQQEVEQSLQKESERTAAFLRQEPFYSQGQFRGILIEPGSDPGLLAQMGLKPGDVLQHVNGAMVVDPDRLDVLRERLASGKPVQVSVIRPGIGPVDVTIDSNLVAAMIEN